MGLKDFIAANVDLSKVDTGIQGLAQYGILGNKILDDAKKVQEEKESQPKPGKYCEKLCTENENCQECLVSQQKFDELFEELEKLETAFENPQNIQMKKMTECPLCGAPYERGEKLCSYCATPYPTDVIDFDIPQSKQEQTQILEAKAAEVYQEYYNFWKKASENRQKELMSKMPVLLQGVTSSFAGKMNEMMTLTPKQIAEGAKKHDMRLSEYIRGLMDGSVTSQKVEMLEKLNEQIKESNVAQQEYNERSREIERQRQEKLRQINQERYQRQLNMINSKTVQYSGGADRCCGNCRYYMPGSNKCVEGKYPNGARDNCGLWKLL